jgi:hypothetical protein
MAENTIEKKFADMLAKHLDSLEPEWVPFAFARQNAAIQQRLFDVIMAFLNHYAMRYTNGDVEPGQKLYAMCEMSHKMLAALTVRKR